VTAYLRFRFAWGLVDFQNDPGGPTYHAGNTQSPIAANILARKMTVEWDRSAQGLDVAQTHFDIANVTNGQLDDSWTDADFSAVEQDFFTFWNAIKIQIPSTIVLSTLRWYRVGPGATPPEPAVRVTPVSSAGTSTGPQLPTQVAENITLRTGLRKAWGRAYLPAVSSTHLTQDGYWPNADVDQVADQMNAFVLAMAAQDFHLVVYSPTHQQAYNVEKIAVDNVFDTQRRRRHRTFTHRKVWPA